MDVQKFGTFDIKRHKRSFTDYLEVVIHSDGTVEYAIPSHNEKLIAIISAKTGETREEISNRCPPEWYADFGTWLAMQAGCISVWNGFFMGPPPSPAQIKKLEELKMAGLYKGCCYKPIR